MDNNFNFINDGFNNDLRPPTTDSQAENPNVNYNASHSYNNNNSYPMMNDNVSSASYTNTSGYVDIMIEFKLSNKIFTKLSLFFTKKIYAHVYQTLTSKKLLESKDFNYFTAFAFSHRFKSNK
ncbi:hypothetical protein RhiirA4_456139 [Rhizophagus irregularis]|uniref:Uncharacterized protein n=1 Tax=Rhizophagus irregularis TaxID=588596 RepID=A0A2I1G6T7_9GLOM|nr:hypothetical protein RhiirA4_456139 [Rhizophagus irregularis]